MLARRVLPDALAEDALVWFETVAPWRLRVASFYEQWEMHLDADELPPPVRPLLDPTLVRGIADDFLPAGHKGADLVEATAHRLSPGQTIRIHNDYRPGGETGRLLVQLNRGWDDAQGGLLMLFASADPSNVAGVVRPVHGSGFGFEISPTSFHAVSTVSFGERYTLVYSFRRSG